MTSKLPIRTGAAALVLAFAACASTQFTHVKPGNSARAHLETLNNPVVPITVSKPGELPIPANHSRTDVSSANNAAAIQPLPLPDVPGDPAPAGPPSTGEKVADLFSRGSSALRAGQTGEAIVDFEEAVKLDPNFADAWTKLAAAYSKAGQDAKAIEAYKTAKKLGQANGGGSGGAGLVR